VYDLDKNGKNVIVIPGSLSGYEGANSCMAMWNTIYMMQSDTLVDKSSEFKNYYRDRIDSLNARMQIDNKRDQDDHRDRTVCTQMEIDKIERYLGLSPNAGKDQAIAWIKSGDQYLRRKGFSVLEDIGDQPVELTSEPDPKDKWPDGYKITKRTWTVDGTNIGTYDGSDEGIKLGGQT
jgi:hypothetical protein